jgi:hypothetical protein
MILSKATVASSTRQRPSRSRSSVGRLQGWRPIDDNSGDQGGVDRRLFEFWWKGGTLYARNNAVSDSYPLLEQLAGKRVGRRLRQPRRRALIWRARCITQMAASFFRCTARAVVPLALPGDDVTPERFVTFWCDGARGLYIRPKIWHGAVVPLDDHAEFLDRQGRVHARVSVDFVKEFSCYLAVPTPPRDNVR